VFGERPIGSLVIRFYGERESAGPDEQRIFDLLAAQTAPALEAARLYATSTLEREHERALRATPWARADTLNERHVLALPVRSGGQFFRAPSAGVCLYEPSGELVCAAA